MTSFDTLYLRLEHSKMPATTDSKTANDPANKQSMGNNEMDISFCKFSMGLRSSSLKLISKGMINMSQIWEEAPFFESAARLFALAWQNCAVTYSRKGYKLPCQ